MKKTVKPADKNSYRFNGSSNYFNTLAQACINASTYVSGTKETRTLVFTGLDSLDGGSRNLTVASTLVDTPGRPFALDGTYSYHVDTSGPTVINVTSD